MMANTHHIRSSTCRRLHTGRRPVASLWKPADFAVSHREACQLSERVAVANNSQWPFRHARQILCEPTNPLLENVVWFYRNAIFVCRTLMPPDFVEMVEGKFWKILFEHARWPAHVAAVAEKFTVIGDNSYGRVALENAESRLNGAR